MKIKYFLENFDNMKISDLIANYASLRDNLWVVVDKMQNISNKYSGNIEVDQIPTLMTEITELISLIKD